MFDVKINALFQQNTMKKYFKFSYLHLLTSNKHVYTKQSKFQTALQQTEKKKSKNEEELHFVARLIRHYGAERKPQVSKVSIRYEEAFI